MRYKIFTFEDGLVHMGTFTKTKTIKILKEKNRNPALQNIEEIVNNMVIGPITVFILTNDDFSLYIKRVK